MHTSRNFAILRDFMEIAWYRDHRDKYSSLLYTGLMDPLWMSKLLFAIYGKVISDLVKPNLMAI